MASAQRDVTFIQFFFGLFIFRRVQRSSLITRLVLLFISLYTQVIRHILFSDCVKWSVENIFIHWITLKYSPLFNKVTGSFENVGWQEFLECYDRHHDQVSLSMNLNNPNVDKLYANSYRFIFIFQEIFLCLNLPVLRFYPKEKKLGAVNEPEVNKLL